MLPKVCVVPAETCEIGWSDAAKTELVTLPAMSVVIVAGGLGDGRRDGQGRLEILAFLGLGVLDVGDLAGQALG